jgi:hypothetical protein
MDNPDSDQFLVYVREHDDSGVHGVVEEPLASFATYAEARRMQQDQFRAARDCVIRYVGPSGGGD